MDKVYCAKCNTEMLEGDTTDDLDGKLRTYFKCSACKTEVYYIVGQDEDETK
jgi:RNase P subunit RPR2